MTRTKANSLYPGIIYFSNVMNKINNLQEQKHSALFLAGTVDQFIARICCFRKSGPKRLPPSCFLCPALVTGLWHLWIHYQCLVPTVVLVTSPPDVLFECSLSWRKVLCGSRLLCEQLLHGSINFQDLTGSMIVHQNNKSLQQ